MNCPSALAWRHGCKKQVLQNQYKLLGRRVAPTGFNSICSAAAIGSGIDIFFQSGLGESVFRLKEVTIRWLILAMESLLDFVVWKNHEC
jgi:hypothetical protein